jgi:lipopolysaccharide/colanic/teichoic acid biosynthesis glycosyltransferase/GGDEF domain-containing protein
LISNASHRTHVVPPMLAGGPAPYPSRRRGHRALSLHARKDRLGLVRPRVLDEAVFRDLLTRERKRTDRSDHPFVLFLVELQRADRVIGQTLIEALAVVKRKMDVVGRFGTGAIGVFLPGVRASETEGVRERFATRLRQELARRLSDETAGQLSIRVHVHPEPSGTEADRVCRMDPIVFPVRTPRRTIADAIKRLLDIVGSAALLVLLSPLFLMIAALVKLRSRGPVIYEQVRVGQNMKPFTMLKFRTMYLDADHARHREFVSSFIKADRQECEPGAIPFFKLTGDPRITPIGHLLRKTSLDELPQLWNVLRGDMSLVGPRPALPYELEQYKPWHRRRVVEAKPGVTGLWQVTGRSRTTFDEMVRLDLQYARRCSLWTDIKILLATPAAVISGKGAC